MSGFRAMILLGLSRIMKVSTGAESSYFTCQFLKKSEKGTGVFSSLLKELRFMQKYVFPLRQADKYSLLQ